MSASEIHWVESIAKSCGITQAQVIRFGLAALQEHMDRNQNSLRLPLQLRTEEQ